MAVDALLAALAIARKDVRDGRADAGSLSSARNVAASLSSARNVAAVKKIAEDMPAKDTSKFSAEALERTLSLTRHSIDAGNADVPPGTVAPGRAFLNNCNRSLHFNMVLRSMAKGFIQSAAAHLAAESIAFVDQAASDDYESSADNESVQEAHDFDPPQGPEAFP